MITSETLNHAASGNGAITLLFHAGRLQRAVPEQRLGVIAPLHYDYQDT